MIYTKQKENSFFVKTSKIATLDKVQNFELKRKSQLNKIIKNLDNSPDYLAINIYYDTLRSWYAPNKLKTYSGKTLEVAKLKTKGIYLCYKELAKAHGCSTETIRRKLVKLEKLGLIQRGFKHRETITTKSYNQLIIYVWRHTPHFFNKHGIDQSEVWELRPQTNHEYISEKYNIDYHSKIKQIKAIESRGGIHKEVDTKKLIELFSKEKNRSIESNFNLNSSEENALETTQAKATEEQFSTKKVSAKGSRAIIAEKHETKKLKDFYPLSEEDCSLLQSKSGRSFSLKAMNEILQDMSKKLLTPEFWSKKGFLAYMSKAFTYEMRDELKVSNISFKIRNNYTEVDKQEKFLSEIEYSQQVSPEWHLKKRLAAVLRRDIAYKILSNYQRSERKRHIFKIYLKEQVAIREMDRQIILNQIKATQEIIGDNREIEYIEEIEFIFSKKKEQILEKGESEKLAEIKEKEEIKKLPIWLQIRRYFINYSFYIREGIGRDKSWLSRLKANEDDKNKTLILTAENNFIRDWINSNYLFKLELIAKELGYSLFLVDNN